MLGDKLRSAFDKLRMLTVVDRDHVKEIVKELQRALIASDVEISLVLELSKKIEHVALEEIPIGLSRREHVLARMYELLVDLVKPERGMNERPKKILLIGLFGTGKTSTAGKLAHWYKKRARSIALIAADVYRPAAFEQLTQLANKIHVPVLGDPLDKNAVTRVQNAIAQIRNPDLMIVDSAGRSALDPELIEELKQVKRILVPDEIWLVLNADIGQVAKQQAQAFHDALGVTGIIISKMDGSAKGGGTLAACKIAHVPVYFIGTGEHLEDLQVFDAERYLSRIMGYGDLPSLLEKINELQSEDETNALSPEELLQSEFTLKTFYKQLEATRKLGPLGKVAEMMGIQKNMPADALQVSEDKLNAFKAMMESMTEQERLDPAVISTSRMKRIAQGSGHTEFEVRELLKLYRQMSTVFSKFKKINPQQMQSMEQKDVGKFMQKLGIGKPKKKKFRFK